MNKILPAIAGLAGLACSLHVSAQIIDSAASPSEPPGRPLWELGLGGGVISTPTYPGADDRETRVLAIPTLIYRGKILRADQSGIGARLFRSENAELDVGLAASLPAKSDDVDARAGMTDLGALGEFGPRLKLRLARFDAHSGLRAELPLRAVFEVRSGVRHQGYTFEPRLVYERRSADGKWLFDTQLSSVVGDGKINRYLYEVAPRYATAERPAYAAKSGLILVRLGAFAARQVNPDLRVFGYLRVENYGVGANDDSPLHRKNNGVSGGIGLSWALWRSKSMARD